MHNACLEIFALCPASVSSTIKNGRFGPGWASIHTGYLPSSCILFIYLYFLVFSISYLCYIFCKITSPFLYDRPDYTKAAFT